MHHAMVGTIIRRVFKAALAAWLVLAAVVPAAAQTQDHQYSAEDIQATLAAADAVFASL